MMKSGKSEIKTEDMKWDSSTLGIYISRINPKTKKLPILILGETGISNYDFTIPTNIYAVNSYNQKARQSERITVLINNEWLGRIYYCSTEEGNSLYILNGFLGRTLPGRIKSLPCYLRQAFAQDDYDRDYRSLRVHHTLIIKEK